MSDLMERLEGGDYRLDFVCLNSALPLIILVLLKVKTREFDKKENYG